MIGKWQIAEKQSLVLRDSDNNTIYPSAEEVFISQFKNKHIIRSLNVKKPSDDLESITFSKYPVDLKVVLEPITVNENIYIGANIVVNKKKSRNECCWEFIGLKYRPHNY
ncbi:hypothetical protein ACWA17_08525 [Bacillus halotolerans]